MRTHLFLMLFFIILGWHSPSNSLAAPLMSKEQYINYAVQYRCINHEYHDDLNKKEEELIRLDEKFGLNDDNFDAFDELVTEYERDAQVLDQIITRAREQCAA